MWVQFHGIPIKLLYRKASQQYYCWFLKVNSAKEMEVDSGPRVNRRKSIENWVTLNQVVFAQKSSPMRKANFSKQSHLFIKINHHSKAILAGPRRNGLLETSLRQGFHDLATTRPQHTRLTSGHSSTPNGTPLCLWNATSSLPRDYTCLLCWQQSYSSKLSNNLKHRSWQWSCDMLSSRAQDPQKRLLWSESLPSNHIFRKLHYHLHLSYLWDKK